MDEFKKRGFLSRFLNRNKQEQEKEPEQRNVRFMVTTQLNKRGLEHTLSEKDEHMANYGLWFTREEMKTPKNAPEWASNRASFWQKAADKETRKDAIVATEVRFGIPDDLPDKHIPEMMNGWVKDNVTSRGLVADWSVYLEKEESGINSGQAHILINTRPIESEDFGKKVPRLQKEDLQQFRESYLHHFDKAYSQDYLFGKNGDAVVTNDGKFLLKKEINNKGNSPLISNAISKENQQDDQQKGFTDNDSKGSKENEIER